MEDSDPVPPRYPKEEVHSLIQSQTVLKRRVETIFSRIA